MSERALDPEPSRLRIPINACLQIKKFKTFTPNVGRCSTIFSDPLLWKYKTPQN